MRSIILSLFTLVTIATQAQALRMTDETSEVKFVTKHLAGKLEGTFKGVQGSAQFNPADLAHSYFKFVFAVATIQSNDPVVGPNFIQQGCFYPAKYPNIELFSSSITKLSGDNQYLFNGSLKIKGVSRFISFPMMVTANAGGYDFRFAFAFRKKDFNVKCGTSKDFKILVNTYGKQM
jgi:polyisoprenoid-binding protein YceI